MGLFSIFRKKKAEQTATITKDITVNENGEIKGVIPLEVSFNGKKFGNDAIPINTTADKLNRWLSSKEQNRNNPASCEREPATDEMLLPLADIDKYRCIINLDIATELFDKRRSASFNGYNNIVISRSYYDRLEQAYQEQIEL